eukprot:348231_1
MAHTFEPHLASTSFNLCVLLIVLILVSVSVYGNIKLFKCRQETFMKKRSAFIVFGLNIIFIAQMLNGCLIPINFNSFGIPWQFSKFPFFLTFIFRWILLFFLNARNYIIYFQSHWTYNTVQLQWQQSINPDVKNKKNWFIDHHKQYGNPSTIFKIFFILHFVGLVIGMVGVSIRLNAAISDTQSVLAIPLIIIPLLIAILFYLIILCKTPTFKSHQIYIHWESNLHSKLLGIELVGMFIFMICSVKISWTILISIFAYFDILIYFVMNYVSTFQLINKNFTAGLAENIQHNNDIGINDILSNKRAVHYFFMHLMAEWSIECLLAYIEITQFETFITKMMDTNDKVPIHVTQASNIPQSAIIISDQLVTNDKKCASTDKQLYITKIKAHKLYNKYIKLNSEFEINISSKMRKRLRNVLEDEKKLIAYDIDLYGLIKLFEKPKYEMYQFLNTSYLRFKTQPEFEQIIALFPEIMKQRPTQKKKDEQIEIEIVYKDPEIF